MSLFEFRYGIECYQLGIHTPPDPLRSRLTLMWRGTEGIMNDTIYLLTPDETATLCFEIDALIIRDSDYNYASIPSEAISKALDSMKGPRIEEMDDSQYTTALAYVKKSAFRHSPAGYAALWADARKEAQS